MIFEKAHEMLCSQDSKIGDLLEWYAGDAADCWCCSMVRGIVLGAAIVGAAWAATTLFT